MANEYWLSDNDWAMIEPLIPTGRRGVKPRKNRRIISGILHVLKFGCRWRDCPAVYGPHTTVYNRFNRWSKAGIWQAMCDRRMTSGFAAVTPRERTQSKKFRAWAETSRPRTRLTSSGTSFCSFSAW